MSNDLKGKTVAILATDGFEQSELTEPRKALDAAGARTRIVALEEGKIRGWNNENWGDEVDVDVAIADAKVDDFDALVLPGGVISPDRLRRDARAVEFVRGFFAAGKPVGAVCHGPQLLIEADVTKGRTLTSFDSIKTDLKNAGANWVDQEVVVDQGLVTSRRPADLPAFSAKVVEEVAEGVHRQQAVHASVH